MTKVNGMAVTFAMDMEYIYVNKPDGYSETRAEAILEKYENQTSESVEKSDYPASITLKYLWLSD